MDRKEFHYAFQITRKVIFEVSYYTLGSNKQPYFATSASEFNQPKTDFCMGGQCQKKVLTGEALEFYKKWDKKHLKDLTDKQYERLLKDIDVLKKTYNYDYDMADTFAGTSSGLSFLRLKELSMKKIGKPKNIREYIEMGELKCGEY